MFLNSVPSYDENDNKMGLSFSKIDFSVPFVKIAVDALEKMAKSGDNCARYALIHLHTFNDDDSNSDINKIENLFKEIVISGGCNVEGLNKKSCKKKIISFLSKKKDDALTEHLLATMHFYGICMKQDTPKGIELFNTSAEKKEILSLMARGIPSDIEAIDKTNNLAAKLFILSVKYSAKASLNNRQIKLLKNPSSQECLNEITNLFHHHISSEDKQQVDQSYYTYALYLHQLAQEYARGDTVPKDYQKTLHYYKQSAKYGYKESNEKIAYMYAIGLGVDKDENAAIEFFKLSPGPRSDFNIGGIYYNSFFCNKDPQSIKTAIEYFEKAAQHKQISALEMLSKIFKNGTGTDIDLKRSYDYALQLMTLDSKNPKRIAYLAEYYREGWGVEKDPKKAFKMYNLAAEKRDFEGCLQLGICYATGSGVEQDLKKAIDCFQKSIELGGKCACETGYALYKLGSQFRDGKGVEANLDRAVMFFKKAVSMDSIEAMEALACIYFNEGNEKLAYNMAQKAIDAHDSACGHAVMGMLYFEGVDGFIDADKQQAFNHFNAASAESPLAKVMLGIHYYGEGLIVSRDEVKALGFITDGARYDIVVALTYLANYETKQENYRLAAEYWERAAKQDDDDAIYALADCYEKGLGVEINIGKAIELCEKINDDTRSKNKLINLYRYPESNVKENLEKRFVLLNEMLPDCNSEIFYLLADCYMYGRGTIANQTLAKDYLKLSVMQGHPEAEFWLGWYYLQEGNIKEGIDLLKKSAAAKNPNSCCHLANYYAHGYYIEQDVNKAIELATPFAELPIAKCVLGYCHYLMKNNDKALENITSASNSGIHYAYHLMANFYSYGECGLKIDLERAFSYRLKAANESKLAEYQFKLAECLLQGKGVQKNPQAAYDYYVLAAKQGFANAYNALGYIYLAGLSLIPSLEIALQYFEMAAALGKPSRKLEKLRQERQQQIAHENESHEKLAIDQVADSKEYYEDDAKESDSKNRSTLFLNVMEYSNNIELRNIEKAPEFINWEKKINAEERIVVEKMLRKLNEGSSSSKRTVLPGRQGLSEMRNKNPALRLYYYKVDNSDKIVLVMGGNKQRQDNDVAAALQIMRQHKKKQRPQMVAFATNTETPHGSCHQKANE